MALKRNVNPSYCDACFIKTVRLKVMDFHPPEYGRTLSHLPVERGAMDEHQTDAQTSTW